MTLTAQDDRQTVQESVSGTRGARRFDRVPPWILVAATMFFIAWGGNQFTPLLVLYSSEGIDKVVVNGLLFAYVLGIVPGLAISAPLSDRYGRRPVALPAPWIGIAGSALLAIGGDAPAILGVGRVLCGIALGIAMAVGGSWLKEASSPPYDMRADGLAGARRQGLSLTAGFAVGAAVAGALAQWAPAPHVLPYVAHIVLSVPFAIALLAVPETLHKATVAAPGTTANDAGRRTSSPHDERPKIAAHFASPRFLLVVALTAPWVFGTAGVAYAIIPGQLADNVSGAPIAFSALLCVLTLGSGFVVQQLARRIYAPGSIILAKLTYSLILIGMILAVATMLLLDSAAWSISVGIVAAIVLGCAYGMALQCGLLEVQRYAHSTNLAAFTALFYTLAYLGFGSPMVLSALASTFTYPTMLATGAVIAAASGAAMFVAVKFNAKQ